MQEGNKIYSKRLRLSIICPRVIFVSLFRCFLAWLHVFQSLLLLLGIMAAFVGVEVEKIKVCMVCGDRGIIAFVTLLPPFWPIRIFLFQFELYCDASTVGVTNKFNSASMEERFVNMYFFFDHTHNTLL